MISVLFRLTALASIFILFNIGFSQEFPEVIYPSPTSRELNKYIDYPVDLSTGTPDISIPLYTIRSKGVEIPVNLNYHASGIREGQDDGEVGVGWTLSVNHRVSRVIYGHPDTKEINMNINSYESTLDQYEDIRGPIGESGSGSWHNVSPLLLERYLNRDKFLVRFYSNYSDQTYPPFQGPLLDGEYDRFYYDLPRDGGVFYINNRTTQSVTETSPSNKKITYLDSVGSNGAISGIVGFSIKDVSQNIYSFGEQLDKTSGTVLETNNGPLNKKDVTAWALTDIDTKYGEKIKFDYSFGAFPSKYKKQIMIDIKEAVDPSLLLPYFNTWTHSVDEERKSENYSSFSLSQISGPNEYIEIKRENSSYAGKIDELKIFRVDNNTLIRKVVFFYSTINVSASSYTFLDSLKIYGSNSSEYEKFSFNYYGRDLSPSTVLVPDVWGYNKIVSGVSSFLHNEFGIDHARYHGEGYNSIRVTGKFKDMYLSYLDQRAINNSPELFTLSSITYPTGGTTIYDYEPNKIDANTLGGGIRLRSIKSYEGSQGDLGKLHINKGYEYGPGYNKFYFSESEFRQPYITLSTGGSSTGQHTHTIGVKYSSQALGDPVIYGPNVFYTTVTELIRSNINSQNTGKIVYNYLPVTTTLSDRNILRGVDQPPHPEHGVNQPSYYLNYKDWKKPVLIKRRYFDSNDRLIQKEEYTYIDQKYPSLKGIKVRPFAVNLEFFDSYNPTYYTVIPSFFNYDSYTIEVGKQLLSRSETVEYSGSDSIVREVNYSYNSLNQLNQKVEVNSKGETKKSLYKYPADTPNESYSNMMLAANDIEKLLEEIVVVNTDTVHHVKNQFIKKGELFLPYKIMKKNRRNMLFEEKIYFSEYDDLGNILSVSRTNDILHNYVWSYKGQFPIAEIKGPTYQEIENLLGGATIVRNFTNIENPSKVQIDNFLAPIRNAAVQGGLKETEVRSYSYDTLFGLKSETDPSDKTLFYEYDNMGRLKIIKDHKGAIKSKINYKYRNE